MLDKIITFDQSVTENGVIQVRKVTKIYQSGVELAKSYHRHCIVPGDDYTEEDKITKKIAKAIWDEEFILAYKEKMALLAINIPGIV